MYISIHARSSAAIELLTPLVTLTMSCELPCKYGA